MVPENEIFDDTIQSAEDEEVRKQKTQGYGSISQLMVWFIGLIVGP